MRYLYYSFFLFILLAPPAMAQLTNPLNTNSIPELIGRIIKAILGLSGAVALLMFVYGGVLYLISAGKPDMVKKGKDTFTHAVIGLAIIFTSYAAVTFVIKALQGTA